MTQGSGWGEREMGLLVNVQQAWEARCSCTLSHFPLEEKSQAQKISLGTALCHLGGGVVWVKWNCSSHPLQRDQTCTFLLQQCAGTSLLGIWTSLKALSFVSDYLTQCFSGAPRLQLRRAGGSSCATAGSTARTEVCMSVTQHASRRDSSWVPGTGAGSHSSLKGTSVCGQMLNCCC